MTSGVIPAVCGVGFGECSRMLWRHARGWFRVFSGLGSGLVSWLVESVTVVTGAWASFLSSTILVPRKTVRQ